MRGSKARTFEKKLSPPKTQPRWRASSAIFTGPASRRRARDYFDRPYPKSRFFLETRQYAGLVRPVLDKRQDRNLTPFQPWPSVAFTSRHEAKDCSGVTLRYPYEVRKEAEYFDDIPDEKIPDLASHIVESKAGTFEPERFEDQYEDALKRAAEEEAVRPENRGPARARALQGRQPHGCTTSKC